jgi:hypothetical protein
MEDFTETQQGRSPSGLPGTVVTGFHRLTGSLSPIGILRGQGGRLQQCEKFVIALLYFISDCRCQLMTGWFSPFCSIWQSCIEIVSLSSYFCRPY